MTIWTPDRRLRVFVSSTLGELAEERRVVERAISALRLTPVMFELGARPQPPQDVYRAYVAQSDIFIGLYWQSYGRPAAGATVSGLEDEYDLSTGLPRLLYVKAPAPDREQGLTNLLGRIREEASYKKFASPRELSRLVRDDLATLLSERFAGSPTPTTLRPVNTLPRETTPLVGRAQAVEEVTALLTRPDVRLVTLTGPGGIGKTRLAVAVGERLQPAFGAGAAFVSLAEIDDPSRAWDAIGPAVGADLTGSAAPMQALAEHIGDSRLLLILDNVERLVAIAPYLEDLLAHCTGLSILATSRTVLRVRAEHEYQVVPLPRPDDTSGAAVEEMQAWPAVDLFATRARAVNRNFTLTDTNAAAVVEICRLLDGVPLAIELAAARTRLLDPGELAARLTASLDAVGAGPVDLPERQHTLRATVQWSIGLLNEAELSHVDTLAVFSDGWTLDAAAAVANLDEDRTLELTEALAEHSLIQLDRDGRGPRARMIDTIRTYVAERLDSRPDVDDVRGRHAAYYRNLAERSDAGLRALGDNDWKDRLQQESSNIGVAVRWYLDHDSAPLPHLFRVLWSFWFLREHVGEAGDWVKQAMREVDSLGLESKAELIWTAQVAGLEVGDDEAVIAAARRLGPLLPGIRDPFLRAVSGLAMGWMSPLIDDMSGAIRYLASSLDQLRTQDEPFWTALAAGSLGTLERIAARYDESQRHLTEACELADRNKDLWFVTWSRGQLAILAVQQGRPDHARKVLEGALRIGGTELSATIVARTLAALAWLTLAEGDPEQAALAAGAATGLQHRAGVRTWPSLRRSETELGNRLREALGADRYEAASSAGGRLSRRQAIGMLASALSPDRVPMETRVSPT